MRAIFAFCLIFFLAFPLSGCNNSKLEKELAEAKARATGLESEVERLGSELTKAQNEFRMALEARATKDADRHKRETDALTAKVSELTAKVKDCREASKVSSPAKGSAAKSSTAKAAGSKSKTDAKTPAKSDKKTKSSTSR